MVAPFIRGVGRFARRFGPEDLPSMLRPSLPWQAPPPGVARAVEPASGLGGIRRARPIMDPQDVNFVNPRLAPPEPPPIRVLPPEEEALTAWQSGAFEPRETFVGLRGGGEMRYTPLLPDEIRDIERGVTEDPGRAYLSVLMNYDEARTPQEFGRAMEQARVLRQNMVMDPQYEAALNSALARAAVRFGVPETKFEEYISPILYTNSRQLPRQVSRVGSELEEVSEASVTSNEFRLNTNAAIKNAKRSADLDEIDTTNGGVVGRALASGEINEMDAKRLIDQTNYTRIRLLQNEGVLPKGFKNNVRAKGGKRGIDLLENMSELSEVNKARLYKVALQTAETNDEVAQVYSLAVRDLTSPALLDELDTVLDGKAAYFGRIEGVTPERLARPVETTIDEAAIRQANVEQTAFDARRANADETRPAFPSDDVDPDETIVRGFLATDKDGKEVIRVNLGENEKWVRGSDNERIPVTTGGGRGELVDRSLFSEPEPRPGVRKTDIRTKPLGSGYVERTVYNAQNSDATIAVAKDFNAGGEILTAQAARGEVGIQFTSDMKAVTYRPLRGEPNPGRRTALFQIQHGAADYQSSVDDIVSQLNELYALRGEPLTINFAGNSLSRLGDGTVEGAVRAQRDANNFARRIVDGILDHPERRFQIKLARSGGQHGYDTAFIKAASENGIPTGVSHPSGSYGGVMVANPLDEELKPVFMSDKQYKAFARGNLDIIRSIADKAM